jgi:hypothetical protein
MRASWPRPALVPSWSNVARRTGVRCRFLMLCRPPRSGVSRPRAKLRHRDPHPDRVARDLAPKAQHAQVRKHSAGRWSTDARARAAETERQNDQSQPLRDATFSLCRTTPRFTKSHGCHRVAATSGTAKSGTCAEARYFRMFVTRPAPTVRPPSRIAKRRFSSIAMGWMSATVIEVLSPGITISVPSGSVTTPVTSVVRK